MRQYLSLALDRLRIAFQLKQLDRYLLSQFLGPFVLGIGGFLIIGIADIIYVLMDSFVISGVPLLVVLRLLLYKIPAIMVLFFPMAVLFAVMLTLIRMAKDNEFTVLKSSGIKSIRIITPIFILCLAASVMSYGINELVVPWANHVSDHLIRRAIQKKAPPTISTNVFFKDHGNRYFYIRSIDEEIGEMKYVMVFEPSRKFPRIITATTATWTDKTWTLKDGQIQNLDDHGAMEYSSHFDEIQIHVDRSVRSFYTLRKKPGEMDSRDLKEKIDDLEEKGIETRKLRLEYYTKYSVPFSCFIFGLIGSAFCVRYVKSGRDWWGVIIAIISVVLLVGFFMFLTAYFKSLGKKGDIIPFLGAWAPNFIYGIPSIGALLYDSRHH